MTYQLPIFTRQDNPIYTKLLIVPARSLSMLPKVILHIATSLDGRITNFPADLDRYYSLAARWNPDAILFGSETVLAAVRENPALEVPQEHEEMFRPPIRSSSIPALSWSSLTAGGGCAAGTPSGNGPTCGMSLLSAHLQPRRIPPIPC